MYALALAALIGVVHVHHAPSHDSSAPFEDVLAGADAAGLDFVVLTEHAEPGALPGREHQGVHTASSGRAILVLVGAEVATADGHLLALAIDEVPDAYQRRGRDVIADVHAQGGFAVVPHPFSHGGWRDWDAPFDGIEVQNTASDYRRLLGPLLPLRMIQLAFDRDAVLARLWLRPDEELARFEALSVSRRVVGLAGADAHQNQSLLGWQLDPYAQQFSGPRMICPDAPLEPAAVWALLREGRCSIRYALYESRAAEAVRVDFPSGRSELQLDGGARVLEISNPPAPPRGPRGPRGPAQSRAPGAPAAR